MVTPPPKAPIPSGGRIRLIVACTLVFLLLLGGRSAYLQVVQGPSLRENALRQQVSGKVILLPRRGTIFDRNGNILAQTTDSYRVDIRPSDIPAEKRAEVARALATCLSIPPQDLLQKLETLVSPFPLDRQISVNTGEEIQALAFPGVDVYPSAKRVYPLGSQASHVLGFVHPELSSINVEEYIGGEGLEFACEDLLHGKAGQATYLVGPTGERLPLDPVEFIPPQDGNSLVLTLDSTIQSVTEEELKIGVETNSATTGCAIVLDSRTGEVLALASYPAYNPLDAGTRTPSHLFNVATQFLYEPGSVFKFVTGAAALEEGVTTLDTEWTDDGTIYVDDWPVLCPAEFGAPHGVQKLAELFQNSCNVGFAKIGLKLGAAKFRQYANAFGFGRLNALELPQAAGRLDPADLWPEIGLATASFGYSMMLVTPLQIAAAFQIVANDGHYVPLHLIKEIRDPSGKTLQTLSPQATRQVISQKTAIQLRQALRGVVESKLSDTLRRYGVAGKTGTANSDTEYNNTTFVGAFPADNPRVVILVNINQPQVDLGYAVRVCYPVFEKIVSKLVDILRVEPPQ
ncbi:MAG: penicillin-binding protein 2 [bacterium]